MSVPVPIYLRRRNGRLMRRGQLPKQKLTYVRRSRRPVILRGIVNDLSDSSRRYYEYANRFLSDIHRALSVRTSMLDSPRA